MQQLDYISQFAPAALATHQSGKVSPTYAFLSTSTVIEALEKENWIVVEAHQARSRHKDVLYNPYAKHQIIFADADVLKEGHKHEEIPRIMLTNAHDGRSLYRLNAGLWRYICSNGLVISDGLVQSVNIRHHNHTIEEVLQTADAFRANSERITQHVAKFREVTLSDAAMTDFALTAISLRGLGTDSRHVVQAADILDPRRSEDAGNSLWRVFNRVQERLLNGYFTIYRMIDGDWRTRQGRPIKAIDASSNLNTGLWDLAEQFSLN